MSAKLAVKLLQPNKQPERQNTTEEKSVVFDLQDTICQGSILDSLKSKITPDKNSIFIFEKGLDFLHLLWYCCVLTGGRNNMDIINELWYGNVSPFEQCTRGDKRLKALLKLVARNREKLDGMLTDKQKETLEKFEDCMNEMHSITERDAFSYGFRLGVQLMAEAFLLPLGEDENR